VARPGGVARRWRSLLLLAAGLLLLAGWAGGVLEVRQTTAALLANGDRAAGVVVDVAGGSGPERISVKWTAGEQGVRTGDVWVHGSHSYRSGESVTVVYDPANPDRVRTDLEKNLPPVFDSGLLLLAICGLAAATAGAVGLVRRSRHNPGRAAAGEPAAARPD